MCTFVVVRSSKDSHYVIYNEQGNVLVKSSTFFGVVNWFRILCDKNGFRSVTFSHTLNDNVRIVTVFSDLK